MLSLNCQAWTKQNKNQKMSSRLVYKPQNAVFHVVKWTKYWLSLSLRANKGESSIKGVLKWWMLSHIAANKRSTACIQQSMHAQRPFVIFLEMHSATLQSYSNKWMNICGCHRQMKYHFRMVQWPQKEKITTNTPAKCSAHMAMQIHKI